MPGIVPAMRQIKVLAVLFALLPGIAAAQQILPKNTVWGRLGVTASGPAQAIPFATLFANAAIPAGPQSCSSHNWFNALSTAGVLGCAQPSFSDLSSTIAASQLIPPTATTLGGVQSKDCSSGSGAVQKINTDGTITCFTPGGGGTVTTTGSPASPQRAVFSGATSITGVTALGPNHCTIISTGATSCNNGGSVSANNGTYTPTAGILYFKVRMVGSGSGGSGSGTSAVVGGSGAQTSLSTSIAPGASPPSTIAAGGVGGAAGSNCDFTVAGQDGQTPDTTIATPPGTAGGNSFYGGAGNGGVPGATTGASAKTSTGSGGGGAGSASGVAASSAGGAGAYCEKTFTGTLSSTYTYAVGTGGGGGTGGTGAGGAGAAGNIQIDEYFN